MAEFSGQGPELVNSTTAGDQQHAVTCLLANGGHVVAWTTGSGADAVVMAQAYDASGAKSGGELTLLRGYAAGGIAGLADGTFVVNAWQSTYDPSGPHSSQSVARFDAAGNAVGAPVLVDGSGDYDWRVSAQEAFARPDGGFAVVEMRTSRPVPWSESYSSIHVYDAAGNPVALADGGTSAYPQSVIAQMGNGGFVTASAPYTGPGPTRVMWSSVDAGGNRVDGATMQATYTSGAVNDYSWPVVVALQGGSAVVAWRASSNVNGAWQSDWQAQVIDASGHASGGVFSWQYAGGAVPHFTALAGGGFLATWMEQSDIWGQSFDASASPSGTAQYLASAAGADYDVTATADGGFLLDYQAAGNGTDIYEKEFDVVPRSSGGGLPGGTPMIGTAGIDTISLAGAHTLYSVTQHSVSGPDGTIPISSIERIEFGDGYAIALDVDGHAGQAYRLYQAAFDRQPDLPGLGYQMHDLDIGYSLAQVAGNFIASPEFQSKFGAPDDATYVTLLYQHVLDRTPQQFEIDYHVNQELHAGYSRADVLTFFSESPENQANVIGQIGNGMLYVPVG